MKVVLSWLRELCPTDLVGRGARGAAHEQGRGGRGDRASVGAGLAASSSPGCSRSATTRTATTCAWPACRRGRASSRWSSAFGTWRPGDLVPLGAARRDRGPALPEPLGAREIRGVDLERHAVLPRELAISADRTTASWCSRTTLEPGADVAKRVRAGRRRPRHRGRRRTAPTSSRCSGSPARSRPRPATPLSNPDTARRGGSGAGRRRRDAWRSRTSNAARATWPGSSAVCATALADRGAGAADGGRHAADLGGRRRHELRDARARAAAACVRPGAAGGPGIVVRRRPSGGDAGDARRRRADVHRRRPADLRPGAARRHRRRDGRRARRGVRADDRRAARERLLRTRGRPAHAPADRPVDRGVASVRARHRPRGRAGRPPTGRAA